MLRNLTGVAASSDASLPRSILRFSPVFMVTNYRDCEYAVTIIHSVSGSSCRNTGTSIVRVTCVSSSENEAFLRLAAEGAWLLWLCCEYDLLRFKYGLEKVSSLKNSQTKNVIHTLALGRAISILLSLCMLKKLQIWNSIALLSFASFSVPWRGSDWEQRDPGPGGVGAVPVEGKPPVSAVFWLIGLRAWASLAANTQLAVIPGFGFVWLTASFSLNFVPKDLAFLNLLYPLGILKVIMSPVHSHSKKCRQNKKVMQCVVDPLQDRPSQETPSVHSWVSF